jgi:enoyl-[acyl-carrier-protein] reductase (NADH)
MAGNPAIDRLALSHVARFLASEESRIVTGQILPVDSGATIA